MPTRTARTAWNGNLQEGSGQVELSSSKLGTFDVSWPKRTSDEAGGSTSPTPHGYRRRGRARPHRDRAGSESGPRATARDGLIFLCPYRQAWHRLRSYARV